MITIIMRIKPFAALRPAPEYAARVASVPYDTVSRSEAEALADGNPLSFLRVTRPEIEFPEDFDPYSESVYKRASENFKRLRESKILIREDEPNLYLYRLESGSHGQTGIIACCNVDDYAENIIRKHEKTRNEKEQDRTRLISETNAHTGPALIAYRDIADIEIIINRIQKETPLYDITAKDGVTHSIWRIHNHVPFVEAFRELPEAYIADGHHRAAAALRVARERRITPTLEKEEESEWFPAILFPASKLRVLPYNRCVLDLQGMREKTFLDAVRSGFSVTQNASPNPETAGHISMYIGGKWYDLDCGPISPANDPIASLDVSILQDRLLGPVLGIRDPRADKRIEYIGGDRGHLELRKMVDSGQAAVAFSMFPVAISRLMAIADAGGIMPPKSTWFDPKPMSGLIVHSF